MSMSKVISACWFATMIIMPSDVYIYAFMFWQLCDIGIE